MQQKNSVMAIVGLIISIIAVLFFWVPIFGLILAITAVIITVIAIRNVGKYQLGGRGLAIAGIIIGVIALLLTVVVHFGFYALFIRFEEEQRQDLLDDLNDTDDPIIDDPGKKKIVEPFSVKLGPPKCPPGTGGYVLGSSTAPPGSSPSQFSPPKLIGPWGDEATFSCSYKRDTGEGDGEIIYEDAYVEINYQTSGSFSARPAWAREDYCSGKTTERRAYNDEFSPYYVAKVTYSTISSWPTDSYDQMRTVAVDLMAQVQEAPYAIKCP